MRTDLVTISPEASVRQLARVLSDHGVSGVPVVAEDGTLAGTVTVADVMWLGDELLDVIHGTEPLDSGLGTVRDIMTPDLFGLGPDADLRELLTFFARTGLRRAPVLQEGRLLGIVSATDLLALIAASEDDAPQD
jgi:CBS domain-containing protein